MPKITRQSLQKKGWNKAEIEKTMNILEIDKLRTQKMEENMHKLMYWMALVGLAMLNFILVVFMVPLVIVFKGWPLYIIIATFGFIFGLLFNYMISSIEHLEAKHHIIAWVFLPILSVFDIFFMLYIAEKIEPVFNIHIAYYMPYIIITFIAAFILPYLIFVLTGKHKLKSKTSR